MKIIKTILIITIIPILVISVAVCDAASMDNTDLDESYITLDSALSRSMFGDRETIPRRSSSYGISADKLPKPVFVTLDDEDVQERLKSYGSMMLGKKAMEVAVKDNGSSMALDLESGVAWAAKKSGAFTLKTHNGKRGCTIVKNADHAVNLALEQIAKSGLLKLAQYETLDVVSVTSTHYAGWMEKDGKLIPVYFDDGNSEEPVTQYKSEYTVNFGRRYRGVPIIGPTLSVKLDAEGQMVAFRKGWRDIRGETEVPVDILSEKEIDSLRDPELAKKHVLKRITCGYVEGPGVGYDQKSPGLGCHCIYENPAKGKALDGELDEWINISTDRSEPLMGKRMRYTSGLQEPIEGKDID